VWNFLSEETRAAPSISQFKNSLYSYDLSTFIFVCLFVYSFINSNLHTYTKEHT